MHTGYEAVTAPGPPLVTVLTPVHNGGPYLRECVESVLAQTYSNWEYIIVDNCSTDGTPELIRHYALQDPRIRICTNREFVGVIANHNIALRHISPSSKYTKFAQADDWLFPDCLMRMVELIEAHPSVGIVGSYALRDARVVLDGLPYPSTVVPGRQLCRLALLKGLSVFGSPTSLLLRSDLFRHRDGLYNEANLHADTEACFDLLQRSDFGFVHQVLTYTRRNVPGHTAFAIRFDTYPLGRLAVLLKYGPVYLSADEYATALRNALRRYYRRLAKHMLHGSRDVWTHHMNGLRILGLRFSWNRFLAALTMEALDAGLNPKRTFERLLQQARRARSPSGTAAPV
jgi:glycosyltransferase involved in cell wall biosynthesis